MATATFPLGLALADNPQTSMLQVRLFENAVPAEGFTSLAQIVECTHPDYLGSRPEDWFDADCFDEKWVFRKSTKIDFRMTNPAPGKGAWGWYCTILLAGQTYLLGYQGFDAFRKLEKANDNIIVQVELDVYDTAFLPI